jgi:hypothetical protein
MVEGTNRPRQSLVFVYNAESGLFNALTDLAHKTLSPETYQCNLCALTYTALGMRKDWKRFLETLCAATEFLHADELEHRHRISGVPLPAVFKRAGDELELWIDAGEINACRTVEDLRRLVSERLLAEKHDGPPSSTPR